MSSDDTAPTPAPAPRSLGSGNALPIGHQLHEFEITGLVGEGGFGIVYLARDGQLHRTVAIKEYMPASLASRGTDLQVSVRSERQRETFGLGMRSFVNEARLLASFDHPALIKVYRFWEANGTAYMVMPYYQGPTLKNWLRAQPQPPDEAWLKGMLAPLIDALEVIHADHCYHRDIAPDNILLLGPQKPLLLDFGAARRVIGDATQALTVILKPGYAPIEQYAEVPSMKQGPWTDVYALCAVLYAVIMGKAPPPSVGRMMKDDLVPISQAAAGRYSAPFLAAIDAGLVVYPEKRLQNMAELRRALFATEIPPGGFAPLARPEAANIDDDRTVVMPAGTDPMSIMVHTGSPTTGPQTTPPTGPGSATAFPATMHVGGQPAAPTVPPTIPPSGPGGVTGFVTTAPGMAPSTAAPNPVAAPQNGSGKSSRTWLVGLLAAGVVLAGGGGWWWQQRHARVTAGAPGATSASTSEGPSATVPNATSTAPAATALPPARIPFTIVDALEDIARNADPLMSVNMITDKSQLVIGKDRLLFQVKSSVPGYLYVYLAGTDQNHFYLLFPNGLDRDNHIEADSLVELPRKGWHITADGPPGMDHIVAIVSPTPRNFSSLPLNTRDAIPEFDMDWARRTWDAHEGPGSPFVPPAVCTGNQPCDQRYGASLVHIEEIALR